MPSPEFLSFADLVKGSENPYSLRIPEAHPSFSLFVTYAEDNTAECEVFYGEKLRFLLSLTAPVGTDIHLLQCQETELFRTRHSLAKTFRDIGGSEPVLIIKGPQDQEVFIMRTDDTGGCAVDPIKTNPPKAIHAFSDGPETSYGFKVSWNTEKNSFDIASLNKIQKNRNPL